MGVSGVGAEIAAEAGMRDGGGGPRGDVGEAEGLGAR